MDSKYNHSIMNEKDLIQNDREIDKQSNDNISLKNYDNSNTFTTFDSKYEYELNLKNNKNKIIDQSYDNETFLKSKEDNQYCILPNNTRSNGFYEDDSDSNNSKKDESEQSSNCNSETNNTELNNSASNLSTSVNKLNTVNYVKYFEKQLKNVKSSYSSKELEESEDSNLLNIFYSFDLIIFTDDYKLLNKSLINFFCFWNKNCISESNFPGIAFLSFDSINYLKYKNLYLGFLFSL